MAILQLTDICKDYQQGKEPMRVLKNICMTVGKGDYLAIMGPSGSGKNEVAKALCKDKRFKNPKTYCTKEGDRHKYLPEEEFAKQNFFEKTRYAGVSYGSKKEDIEKVLSKGKFAVIPLDMCGAIAMKRHFPTAIIYLSKPKENLIREILETDYPMEEKTLRLLSLDVEKRNRTVCDYVIDNTKHDGAKKILELIEKH